MKLPHPIPYQGSKRNIALDILKVFPNNTNTLIEPFAGSAAITIASAFYGKANKFIINDINKPLTRLWDKIINNPQAIAKEYTKIWSEQLGRENECYYEIRTRFNETQQPEYLLFLLAKCVKAAVRYNSNGGFNQSPDKRRLGRSPDKMKQDIIGVSNLLKGKIEIHSMDYMDIFKRASTDDLVYLDPPYQGTGMNGGFNYAGNINYDKFVEALIYLNKKKISFVLSYDGKTGEKEYGKPLPEELNLTKIEINAGRSSQATLLNRHEITIESLYLSPYLSKEIESANKKWVINKNTQMSLTA